jgi:DNA-binding Xre family transcriptional regulator
VPTAIMLRRVALGLTRAELARRARVTRARVVALETGRARAVHVNELRALARVLRCQAVDLLRVPRVS